MTIQKILDKISNKDRMRDLEQVWVGKNYSVADLIRDLKELEGEGKEKEMNAVKEFLAHFLGDLLAGIIIVGLLLLIFHLFIGIPRL